MAALVQLRIVVATRITDGYIVDAPNIATNNRDPHVISVANLTDIIVDAETMLRGARRRNVRAGAIRTDQVHLPKLVAALMVSVVFRGMAVVKVPTAIAQATIAGRIPNHV